MNARLLFADRDLDLDDLPEPDVDLVVDLELERLFHAMADGDEAILAVVRRALPLGVAGPSDQTAVAPTPEAVAARQAVIRDALASPSTVRELYRLASEAVEAERRVWGSALRNAELVLHRSVEVLSGLLTAVEAMRDVLARDRALWTSHAMLDLADRLAADVDDAFLRTAREQLDRLGDRTLVVTAGLGPGNRAAGFTLRRAVSSRAGLRDRVGLGTRSLTVDVTLHDQHAMNSLAELRAQAVAPAAAAVAESAGHLLAFCRRLHDETAFLVGCVNLVEALRIVGVELAMPQVAPAGTAGVMATAIIDPCLALAIGGAVTPNDVDTSGCALTVVTGANGGGKSTVLRAVGVAQVMLNAGLPVAAASFRAAPTSAVLVHFPRGEAAGAAVGRLDAELRRLSGLVDRVRADSLVLLNEPLAAVNERDATAIAGELTRGLVAAGPQVWLVTHHHELAAGLHAAPPAPARFLRAARGDGAARPFLVEPAPPLVTSFGEDLWTAEIDDAPPESAPTRPAGTIEPR